MAVKGSLESLGLEDLLKADLAAQGEGRLTLRSGPRHAALHVSSEGVHVLEPDLLSASLVLDTLIHRRVLTSEAVESARSGGRSDFEAIDTLVEQGHLPHGVLLELCATAAEDTILDLMLWETGQFSFDPGTHDPAWIGLQGRLCVDPGGVRERALARIDRRVAVANALTEHALLFVPAGGELPPLASPEDPLHRIFARLDLTSVVHEIALDLDVPRLEVLEAIQRLVEAGAARPATTEELIGEINRRMDLRQFAVARFLALQWMSAAPDDPAPLKKLASVADAAGNPVAQLDARCALGHLHLQKGEHPEAIAVFKSAMRAGEADEVVLAGLRLASEAAGDTDTFAHSALLSAQTALDEGDAPKALEVLKPVIAASPGHVGAHLLRARALVAVEDRDGLVEQAMAVGEALDRDGNLSDEEREAAAWFQGAIAEVAPDRGDLLERFRALQVRRVNRGRRVAMMIALALVVGGGGFLLWPVSAASLLSSAQEAMTAGDGQRAEALIEELVERFPDSPEAEEAFVLQQRLRKGGGATPRPTRRAKGTPGDAEDPVAAFTAALAGLPAADARRDAEELVARLEEGPAAAARKRVLKPAGAAVDEVGRALAKDARERADVLSETEQAAEKLCAEPDRLAALIERAEAMRDPAHVEDLKASSALIERIAKLDRRDKPLAMSRELANAVESLERAAAYHDANLAACRLTLAKSQLDIADRRSREEAPKLLVSGRLDEADAIYASLESLVKRHAGDEDYAALNETIRRRRIPQFLQERRGQIADIRKRLGRARAQEEAGDLAAAVATYAALVHEHWLIRFQTVFTMPLRVKTVPAGARLSIGGKEVAVGPGVVRYAWGSNATVTARAPGYADAQVVLPAEEETPPSEITIALKPTAQWSAPIPDRVVVAPTAVHGDLLVVDRAGRASLFDQADGSAYWTADHSSLEGVKVAPAFVGDSIFLLSVDGTLRLLDPSNGTETARLDLGRPRGGLGVESGRVAVVLESGEIVALRGTETIWRAPLGGVPTTDCLGAHGAFWVGTADGRIARFDAQDGAVRTFDLAGANAAIGALAATADGMIATAANGSLHVLEPDGATRWSRDGVGDAVGAPAAAGGTIAFAERGGSVHLFTAASGEPLTDIDLPAAPPHGLATDGSLFFAACADGTAWCYDPTRGVVVLQARIDDRARFRPAPFGGDRVAFGGRGARLEFVRTPRAPAAPR